MLTQTDLDFVNRRLKGLQWISVMAGAFLAPAFYLGKVAVGMVQTFFSTPGAGAVDGYSLLLWMVLIGTASTIGLGAFLIFLGVESRRQIRNVLGGTDVPRELTAVSVLNRRDVRIGNAVIGIALGASWFVFCAVNGCTDQTSLLLAAVFFFSGCWDLYCLLKKKRT